MQTGTLIMLNGASSSGKTTLLEALQDCLDEPYINAGLDKFLFMLPERYLERPLWDDVLGLADRAGGMGHTLVSGMHCAIRALLESGINVVADHVLVEPVWARECAVLFASMNAYLVGVRCPVEVLEARERLRKNRTLGQARLQVDLVHANCVYDLEVHTDRNTPQECAAQVKALLDSGQPPRAFATMLQQMGEQK
mgnify:CR=1 FL=1